MHITVKQRHLNNVFGSSTNLLRTHIVQKVTAGEKTEQEPCFLSINLHSLKQLSFKYIMVDIHSLVESWIMCLSAERPYFFSKIAVRLHNLNPNE